MTDKYISGYTSDNSSGALSFGASPGWPKHRPRVARSIGLNWPFESACGVLFIGVRTFDHEAQALLEALAADISHALDRMDLEKERRELRNLDAVREAERLKDIEQYRSIVQASLDGFWITDVQGKILDANGSICRMLGYSFEEILTLSISDIEADETPEQTAGHIRQMIETGHVQFEARHRRKDGIIINVEVSVLHVADLGNRFFAFVRDITDRKQAEDKLRFAASVFVHAREGIMITDANGTIIDVNDAFTQITSYRRDEVIGRNPRILNSGRQNKEFYTAMWRSLTENGYWYGEVWNRRKDGEVYVEMQTVSAVYDDQHNIRHFVALFSDITSIKEHERHLQRIAHYDALTGLPNRILLSDRLRQAMTQSQRRENVLGVVYIDLDGFKLINDSHGHQAGDQLLTTIASRMKQVLREGDTLARLGGDEFIALLLDLENKEASLPMIKRLLAAAATPVEIGDLVLQVSASSGISFFAGQNEVDADQLIDLADQAMYQAKQAGKNTYCLSVPD